LISGCRSEERRAGIRSSDNDRFRAEYAGSKTQLTDLCVPGGYYGEHLPCAHTVVKIIYVTDIFMSGEKETIWQK
jgi:hypothetical protein